MRFFDILISVLILIALSPVIFILIILIYFSMGSPVLFYQKRPGKNNVSFKLFKFRSMNNSKDKKGKLLSDKKRLTGLGSFLRRTSLDEIPSFYNVIKGDMSLVGPRPLLEDYLKYYSKEQLRRHNVRPGITGWAQINGRNTISWEKKFELDLWYVDNKTFLLDIKILAITIWKVLKREGINNDQDEPMPFFNG
tara:strand:+ start:80 stop:661 length:582 start_codon:yes stop_codon:yes gene_type:complete